MIGLTATSRLLKPLADETRLRILHLLAQEELSGTDLMEILNMGQSRVSTHLSLLKEVGLGSDRRAGQRACGDPQHGPAPRLDAPLAPEGGRSGQRPARRAAQLLLDPARAGGRP